MSLQIALALLFDATLVLVCGYALLCGGRPERLGATINLAASVVSTALRLSDASYFAPLSPIIILIDLSVAAGFYWLAIKTTRFWPIWAAGFALADIFMSVAGALLPHLQLFAFQSGLVIYSYLALGTLALGTFRLPRDAEPYLRNGSRRSWIRHLKETN
jgi:hypothetical protein